MQTTVKKTRVHAPDNRLLYPLEKENEMTKFWCGVVSRDHSKLGEQGSYCQVGSGRRGPLARMGDGDGIVLYSPMLQYDGRARCQAFTAIGTVTGSETYLFNLAPTFMPYRRDVRYRACQDAPIRPLLDQLHFTAGFTNWGFKLRLGHFEIDADDFQLIARAMQAGDDLLPAPAPASARAPRLQAGQAPA
jgi:hypothetical protein